MSLFGESLNVYQYKGEPDPETERSRMLTLAAGAETFLRGFGTVSIADWHGFDPEERAVFAAVGDKLRAERALQIAAAIKSSVGEATVMAVIDDGDQLIRLHLTSLLDRLERRA